ncbi:ABC transporter permease [Cytophagales bacterium WSM2-2]|nr:ABC transporter permease [Cytophagales bacterium WSM2-2]
MIKNYLKVALRSILRSRLTSFINLMGLTLAMSAAVLIYLFVSDELSYDRYHAKADRVYRVTREFFDQQGNSNLHLCTVAPPIGPLIKNDISEVQLMARTLQYPVVVAIEENGERRKMASEENVFMAEPEIFNILDIKVISGQPQKALEHPLTVMISRKAAEKYFGTTEVIGKQLKGGRRLNLEVTGVFEDFPGQTHWHPDFLISFSTLYDSTIYGRRQLDRNWGNNSFSTYLVFEEGTDAKKIEGRFPALLDKYLTPFARANGAPQNFIASRGTQLTLQNIQDIHLRSHLDDEIELGGNINNVYMMSVIGMFIVLIACFNFINLSTARATKRAKEVGLRKTVGAFRNQLIGQYLSESVLISFFGLIAAIGLSWATLQWLNDFTGKHLALQLFSNWPLTLGLIGFALVVGLLAGIYPAFIISSFKPALVLKGQQGSLKGKGGIRKVLVIAQFAISIVLIIATMVTTQQLGFLNNINLGFEKDRLVTLTYYSDLGNNYDAFYNELVKSSTIVDAGRSSRIPTGRLLDSQGPTFITKDNEYVQSTVTLKYITTDWDFFKTYGITFAAGRDFSKSVKSDDSLAYIVNEAAVKALGWKTNEEGIDKDFQYGNAKGKLIGIVNDFHFESLHQRIVPMVFLPIKQSYYNYLTVKIAGGHFQEGIEHLQKVWKSFLPIRPFEYQFTSDRYASLYKSEQKENQLFTIFSALAIFIASLGLFGLATFNTLQRIKEIGIRKVLGASVSSILGILSREIVVLVLIANLVAWPIAWIMMGKWLNSFAYHVDMNLLAYLLAAFAAVFIALATVSAQTVKAAMTNPSKTLRYE